MIPHLFHQAVSGRLFEWRAIRRTADAVLRTRGRHELARFDRQSPVRCQLRILLGLLNKAQATPFGRQHDFRRIRTEADFRRLTPLRTPYELERLQPSAGAGRKVLLEGFRAAWRTALAFVGDVRPQARLLSGSLVFLGDGGLFDRAALPWLVRPYALLGCGAASPEILVRTPVTYIAGSVEGIDSLIAQVRQATGRDGLLDLWPDLTAVLYNRRSCATAVSAVLRPSHLGDTAAAHLRALLGDRVLLLETRFLPGGPVAVEDPRHGCLALFFDHGVYFEFTPAEEWGKPAPTRHGLGEVQPGVVYEMAVSTPAGAWACRTGIAVCFERRDPPLLRFVEMPVPAHTSALPHLRGEGRERGDGRQILMRPACAAQAPHRQIAGIPAGPPEKLAHTLWSTRADRG